MPVEPLPCEPGPGPGPGPDPVEPCCAPSITSAPLCLPDGTPILLVLSAPCGECDGDTAIPAVTGWLDPAGGEFTPGPAPEGAGPCADESCPTTADILPRCDATPDGECVPMLRHLLRDCTGAVLEVVDTAPDGVTPYTPTGEVINCDDCPCGDCTKAVPLCDIAPDGSETAFLRHLTYDCESGAVIEEHDTTTDGHTPYTPTGEIGECGQCRPTPMCPSLVGLSGPEVWEMPERTESISLSVVCGPVTVTDCTGAPTVINECGASFNWSAPATSCAPGELCGPFTIELPEGAAVYINLLSPCDLGDES